MPPLQLGNALPVDVESNDREMSRHVNRERQPHVPEADHGNADAI
jgi:hypothetical protein